MIVIAGDREPRDLAGVIELRIRKAIRRGARLVLVGAGGTRLDLLASERIETAPGVLIDSADAIVDRLSGAERPVLLVTDPQPLQLVAWIASKGGLAGKAGGGVLPLPEAPNELGVRAAGFRDDPLEVLERAERGELRMLVLLGDADPVSRWPHADRWRDALQRAESVVVSTLFPNEATGWAHVILPATATLEKEGSTTNLEGRVQRLRPTLPPPTGVVTELALLGELGRQLDASLPTHAPAVHRRLAAAEHERFPGWEATAAPSSPPRSRAKGSALALARGKKAKAAPEGLKIVAYRPLVSGPAVEHAPNAFGSCSPTRSCSRAPTPSGSASPRVSRWSSSTPVAAHRGRSGSRGRRCRAPFACRGRARRCRAPPPSRQRARHARRLHRRVRSRRSRSSTC